jgi:hypothetical protein
MLILLHKTVTKTKISLIFPAIMTLKFRHIFVMILAYLVERLSNRETQDFT